MLKYLISFWGVTVISLAPAWANQDEPTLDLKLDGPKAIKAGGEKIQISGPFAQTPDGRTGLAVGNAQNRAKIPAAGIVREKGTILFSFFNKPIKPENALHCRMIVALGGQGRERIFFYQISDEILYFAFKNYNEPQVLNSRKPIESNRWYQAACTWDGSTVKFYLDGVIQGELKQPYVPKFPAASSFLYLGPYVDGCTNPEPWHEDNCLIREIKVYKRALPPEEIMKVAGIKAVDASKAFKPFLVVPRVSNSPVMDGKLDDLAWQRAASLITLIDGQKPDESLSYKDNNAKFCHDGKNLFVKFESVFPNNYKLNPGGVRGETESDVFGDESFEFWLNIDSKLYRFAGNAAGGYCEDLFPNAGFNGRWQYKCTLVTRIDDYRVWQGEICIPFATLGISSPVGREIKANFCRTWRGLERIGLTALAGVDNYLEKDLYATLKISGGNTAFQQIAIGDPIFGTLAQKFQVFSDTNRNAEYEIKLLSSAGIAPETLLLKEDIRTKAGSIESRNFQKSIESMNFDRLLFQVKDTATSELIMQQVVPFKVLEDYLDVVPAFSSGKVFMKPRYALVKSKATGNPVQVEVVTPSNKTLFTATISSNDEVVVPFSSSNEAGIYRAAVYAVVSGSKKVFTSKAFNYHGIGPWEKPVSEERVLPPFTPLRVQQDAGSLEIGMWGRIYRYKDTLLPTTIISLTQPVVTAASLCINGTNVINPLKVTKSTPSRIELTGQVKSSGYDLAQNAWIEYDGFLWNRIQIKAKENLSGIQMKLDIPKSVAKFYHATAAGFGAGGRKTESIDKEVSLAFWPVVWLGGQEQGIAWFAESNNTWKTSDATPIRIVRTKDRTLLEIRFADKLDKGRDLLLEFGLLATPVKPLPKSYPFTMFGDEFAVHLNPKAPHAPVTAAALLPNERLGEGFYDLPPGAKKPTPEMTRIRDAATFNKQHNCVVFPYQAAIFIPEEYPVVKDNVPEWQISPSQHLTYQYAPYYEKSDGPVYKWFYLCPASPAANYYLYRFKELLKDIPLQGIYFDFGPTVPCSNRYHGCDGRYPILAKREFYKRMAGILADANQGRYTIVVHNSESVQIPVFTFVTHFLNGEGLRQMSSNVFHHGKDLLDHYTLTDFASEHSSLPWGITSSIYVPTDPLIAEFGGDKEGGSGPQELYRFRMTKAAMAGALIHHTIPSQSRMHYGWFDKVIRFYDRFQVNRAEFLPYWRNGEYVRVVQGKDIYVSVYRHAEKKQLLAVIAHVNKEHLDQDVVVEFDPAKLGLAKLTAATELLTGPDPEYKRLYAETNRMRNPVELGDFGVEFKGLKDNRIKLKIKHHSVALVTINAE